VVCATGFLLFGLACPWYGEGGIEVGLFVSVGFYLLACMTWFFSSRPEMFLRTFVPPDERDTVRSSMERPNTERGIRSMAILQAVCATAFLVGMIGASLFR